MHPSRPGSAKTQLTKQTLDSQASKRQHNSSQFSSTFSVGGSSFHQKPDQFKQYVAQKDRDPKFKHLKPKLQAIKQEAKPSFKPFQRKKDKTAEKFNKKVEEKPQKPDEQLNLSRGFAQKSKIKMNSLRASHKQAEEEVNEKIKSKVNFQSFKVNKPRQKKDSKKQIRIALKKEDKKNGQTKEQSSPQKEEKKETKPQGKTEEEQSRQNQRRDLEQYVNEVQARNFAVFPRQYDRMVNASPVNTQDLQKIDLNNFLDDEPTEQDFQLIKVQIKDFDEQLENGKEEESIDLQEIIGDTTTQQEQQRQYGQDSYLESMTASQLKKRNAFLTQVLAGKISKKEIDDLEQMDKSTMKMHKIDRQKEEQDDDIEFSQINMMKRQSNRLMDRNRFEAAGQLYLDCDYLSEQHKKRLEELLQGQIGDSPFEFNELELMRRRRIDEGIRMYRQMNNSQELEQILDEASLPKDPQLKKEAEKKVLKEKMKSVNQRLGEVNKVKVTKAKVTSLIKQFQFTKRSESYNQLYEQQKKKYEESIEKLQQAQKLLQQLEQKQNINQIINEIDAQYNELQLEIQRFTEIDVEKLRQMEKQRLRKKLRELDQVSRQNRELEGEISQMEHLKDEAVQKLKMYDDIQDVEFPNIQCSGYTPLETLQDIDQVITKKWEQREKEPSELQTQ